MNSKCILKWKGFFIISQLTILFLSCSSFEQSNIQKIYKSDFNTPTIKISNLTGVSDSIDYPGETLVVTHYRFDSESPIKIKDRKKFKKIEATRVIEFLQNKNFSGTENCEYLKSNESSAICLYCEEKFPVYLAGSVQIIQIKTIKKWIVFWLKGKYYFVVHVREVKVIARK